MFGAFNKRRAMEAYPTKLVEFLVRPHRKKKACSPGAILFDGCRLGLPFEPLCEPHAKGCNGHLRCIRGQ